MGHLSAWYTNLDSSYIHNRARVLANGVFSFDEIVVIVESIELATVLWGQSLPWGTDRPWGPIKTFRNLHVNNLTSLGISKNVSRQILTKLTDEYNYDQLYTTLQEELSEKPLNISKIWMMGEVVVYRGGTDREERAVEKRITKRITEKMVALMGEEADNEVAIEETMNILKANRGLPYLDRARDVWIQLHGDEEDTELLMEIVRLFEEQQQERPQQQGRQRPHQRQQRQQQRQQQQQQQRLRQQELHQERERNLQMARQRERQRAMEHLQLWVMPSAQQQEQRRERNLQMKRQRERERANDQAAARLQQLWVMSREQQWGQREREQAIDNLQQLWGQPLPESPPDLEQRKREHLEKQDKERINYVGSSLIHREAYYIQILGPNYHNLTFFNAVTQEDTTIGDFIADDPDNIVFVITGAEPVMFASNRAVIRGIMAIYDCDNDRKKYISLNNIGYHGIGVAKYDAVKAASLRSKYQIFALRATGQNTNKLITHEIRYFEDTRIGGLHCQEGSQMPYYQIYIPKREYE